MCIVILFILSIKNTLMNFNRSLTTRFTIKGIKLMANEHDKLLHSLRRYADRTYVKKQVNIAQRYGIKTDHPNRYRKVSSMDCGNPRCPVCGNPRRLYKQLSHQEKKLFQKELQNIDEYKKETKNYSGRNIAFTSHFSLL